MNKENQGAAAPRSLTLAQRARLAREARGLAMDCLGDTPPSMNPWDYSGCALGVLVARAAYNPTGDVLHNAIALSNRGPDETYFVELALFPSRQAEGCGPPHHAVVFPLLALADALEQP